jgi:hypothetical protein
VEVERRGPVVGNLYSQAEQYEMHGGSHIYWTPTKDGVVTLLRTYADWQPDEPLIIDWQNADDPAPRQMMNQLDPIPLYINRDTSKDLFEFMGYYKVVHVATNPEMRTARTERLTERMGHYYEINQTLYLERR